ncbi:hypothetical protein Tco_0074588, partial [Tanacetum coccineum]
ESSVCSLELMESSELLVELESSTDESSDSVFISP